MDNKIYVNDIYLPYLNCDKRLQIYYGGSSSGKSFFLAQRCVLDNLQGANYLICRNVAKTMRNSVFNEVRKAISAMGVADKYAISSSDMRITCEDNGKQILFAGLDDVEKLKSITPAVGVLERCWLEEATECSRDAYMQLRKRLRGQSKMSKYIVLSFNPIIKTHWIYREFFGGWVDGGQHYEDDRLSILKTTYRDNSFLTADDVAELENEADPYYKAVYSDGEWGVLGNVIFSNWRVDDLSSMRSRADNIYSGMDFGFASDPTAFIRAYYDKTNKRVYVLDEHYEIGMHNEARADILRKRAPGEYVFCDSASPELVDDLCRHGIRAVPARKGPGSINAGIDWLQRQEIVLDTRCQHLKNEISTYHWEEDRYGNTLRRPVGRDDHGIDALRYALEPVMADVESGAGARL